MEAVGALNISGNKFEANGANLQLNKTAGKIFKLGINFANDWKDPHSLSQIATTALTFRYRTQNGTEGSDVASINPSVYDLANVLTAVPSNKFSVQTVTLFQTGIVRIQYGQSVYNTLSEAEAAIFTRNYNVEPNIAANGITRAYIIVKNTTTSLQNTSDSKIVEAGKFGSVGGGGGAITLDAIIAALGYTPANDVDVVHKTGDETKYGILRFDNSGSTQTNGILLTNAGTVGSFSQKILNTSSGAGFILDNTSTGAGFYKSNSGSGFADKIDNGPGVGTEWNSVGVLGTGNLLNLKRDGIDTGNIDYLGNFTSSNNFYGQSFSTLKDKKWMVFGDSFSNDSDDYPLYVAKYNGWTNYVQNAVAGYDIFSTVDKLKADLISTPTFLNDVNIASLLIGTNDFGGGVTVLGDINSTVDGSTFSGKLKYFIQTVLTANPNIKLYVCTPTERNDGGKYKTNSPQGWTLQDLRNLIVQICDYYSINVIDLYTNSGFNLQTIGTLTSDGLHPNLAGKQSLAKIISEAFLGNKSNSFISSSPFLSDSNNLARLNIENTFTNSTGNLSLKTLTNGSLSVQATSYFKFISAINSEIGSIGLINKLNDVWSTEMLFRIRNSSNTYVEAFRINESGLLIPIVPTTSASTYDILTRNTSTGIVEKIASASGTYTPTLTNTTNISSSTLNAAYYTRIGNIVTVTIAVQTTLIAASETVLTFSLPISGATVVNGIGQGNLTSGGGAVNGYGIVDITNSTTAQLRIGSPLGIGAGVTSITFMYTL